MNHLVMLAMILLCCAFLSDLMPVDAQRPLRIGCAIAAALLVLVSWAYRV
jgi:hypothetical protein